MTRIVSAIEPQERRGGRRSNVHLDGRCVITPPSSMTGWPAAVTRALGRLAPTIHAYTGDET